MWKSHYSLEHDLTFFHLTYIFITLGILLMDIRCGCLRIGTVPLHRYDESIHGTQGDFLFPPSEVFFISFFFQRMFSIRTQRDSYWNCTFSWTNFEGRHALVTPATVSCERTSEYIFNPEKTTGKAKEKSRRTALAIAFQLPRFGKALASIKGYLIV